ncbi:MAG: OmpA family protein [Hyphomicrobiales bacterium]
MWLTAAPLSEVSAQSTTQAQKNQNILKKQKRAAEKAQRRAEKAQKKAQQKAARKRAAQAKKRREQAAAKKRADEAKKRRQQAAAKKRREQAAANERAEEAKKRRNPAAALGRAIAEQNRRQQARRSQSGIFSAERDAQSNWNTQQRQRNGQRILQDARAKKRAQRERQRRATERLKFKKAGDGVLRSAKPARSKVVSRSKFRRKDGSLVIVERGRNGKVLNRKVIKAKNSRKVRRALNAPAAAVVSGTRRNRDGTTTEIRRRADGAHVRIVRDRNGRVLRRKVENDNRKRVRRTNRGGRRVIDRKRVTRANGTTRTVRHFADGSKVVVIRDRDGYVIDRRVFDAYGYEERWSHNGRRHRVRHGDRDINIFLPIPLPIPVERYVVEDRYATDVQLQEAFLAPPVQAPVRAHTIEEVTQDTNLRSSVRRVDLDTITFATGDDQVPEFQISKLARLADVILTLTNENPDEIFLIEGHTDAVGTDDSNLFLSIRRANSVRQALVDTFDVPAKNLVAEGYGEDYLKIPTDGAERRNRRVAVRRITPLLTASAE